LAKGKIGIPEAKDLLENLEYEEVEKQRVIHIKHW